ncbi:hypothetical protein GCM10010358_68420 [Streptomyces minutiscleroticus]|uniref:MD-2-related lipid-recognition domain-containing protein n=1 Tax=Streptomyces minutiscleroticus TaxID=68238 RepID=A0A918NYM0_9ACTN|nr:hypothetical protein [Streptomyces minutiscleroticus]GGY05326.1 hypothetical protein GCM10010358_68420 [Streptomyces minutiscleroticus]
MTSTFTWDDAGTADHDFVVDFVRFDPQTPAKGQSVTVTAVGALRVPITSGTVQTKVKFGVVHLVSAEEALPATEAGPYAPQATFTVDENWPAGKYRGILSFMDQDSTEIGRVDIAFSLS